MKIDIHTHILPAELPDWAGRFGYGGFVTLEHRESGRARMMLDGRFFREIESNCWDLRRRLAECDRDGVDIQVLSTIPILFSYWTKPQDGYDLARHLNDAIAEAVSCHPDRFIGLGTIPMQAPDLAIREMERCTRELGMPGVEIGTNVNDKNLDEPELFPIFRAAEELGVAIFVHPWNMCGADRMKKYWLQWLVGMPAETSLAIASLIFGGVLERLPKLRIAFAHGGGAFLATLGRIDHGFRVRPDLCATDNSVLPREYLRRIYIDSLVHEPLMLQYLVNLIGADRIALGSDYPFPLGEHCPGELIEASSFDKPTRDRMFAGTALEWLGLEQRQLRSDVSGTSDG